MQTSTINLKRNLKWMDHRVKAPGLLCGGGGGWFGFVSVWDGHITMWRNPPLLSLKQRILSPYYLSLSLSLCLSPFDVLVFWSFLTWHLEWVVVESQGWEVKGERPVCWRLWEKCQSDSHTRKWIGIERIFPLIRYMFCPRHKILKQSYGSPLLFVCSDCQTEQKAQLFGFGYITCGTRTTRDTSFFGGSSVSLFPMSVLHLQTVCCKPIPYTANLPPVYTFLTFLKITRRRHNHAHWTPSG